MSSSEPLSEHAARNRAFWDRERTTTRAGNAEHIAGGEAWGVWQLPEAELRILGDVAGREVLELGCGAAQWSIALARRGARCTGLDNSEQQLEHARAAGADFPLVHASAEAIPFPAANFAFRLVSDSGRSSITTRPRLVFVGSAHP